MAVHLSKMAATMIGTNMSTDQIKTVFPFGLTQRDLAR